MQGYPQRPWPQPPSFSQNKSAPNVGGGEAQEHTGPTQYNPQLYSLGPYEGQISADAGANGDYKWTQQQYDPATEGEGSAGTFPALGAVSMNRATDINHEYFHPHVALMGSQMPFYSLDYTSPQASAPIVVPQSGTTNVGPYIHYSAHDVADMPVYGGWPTAPLDGHGASTLEISEGTGTGAFTNVGYVSNLNESALSAWTTSSEAAGEYTGQQQFPGYTHGVQPPYNPLRSEYVEQSGIGVMPDSAQKHGSTTSATQQQYGQLAQATRQAGLSVSWAAPGTKVCFLPFHRRQSYPSVQGELHRPGTHAGQGKGLDALSPSSPCLHCGQEGPFYPPLDATGETLTPPHYQDIPATVANATDNLMAGAPAGGAGAAAPNPSEFNAPRRHMGVIRSSRMSKTRTGRKGPQRGIEGQIFEESLEKVQERLREEGAEVGAVECLGSEIFVDGKMTQAALKAEMTQEQRKAHEGKQKYMLLLDVVEYSQGSNKERNHRCLLCPPEARAEFKLREDSLRHFYKAHFGLSFD